MISQLYGGGGNAGATYHNDFVELYNRGTTAVDIWRLVAAVRVGDGQRLGFEHAAARRHDRARRVSTSSRSARAAQTAPPLPPANISGLINMSGTSGKIALVNSFDGLVGNCPIGDAHLMDFVGYGSADCREGTTTAPAPQQHDVDLPRWATAPRDTDSNGSDFVTGAPAPAPHRAHRRARAAGAEHRSAHERLERAARRDDPVTFTEAVDVFGAWFDITCAISGQHNSATFAGGGQNHYITPNVNFVAGEQCTVTIFKDQMSRSGSGRCRAEHRHAAGELRLVVHGRDRHRAALPAERASDDGQSERRHRQPRSAEQLPDGEAGVRPVVQPGPRPSELGELASVRRMDRHADAGGHVPSRPGGAARLVSRAVVRFRRQRLRSRPHGA